MLRRTGKVWVWRLVYGFSVPGGFPDLEAEAMEGLGELEMDMNDGRSLPTFANFRQLPGSSPAQPCHPSSAAPVFLLFQLWPCR